MYDIGLDVGGDVILTVYLRHRKRFDSDNVYQGVVSATEQLTRPTASGWSSG
jgi:hypothetical protein